MKRFEKHIFICENKRPDDSPKGSCSVKWSPAILEKFKLRLKELELDDEIRANKAGCLNACAFGPSIVVYPEQIWYGGVTLDDVEEIIQSHLIANKPVERLLIKDPKFNKDNI